MEARSAYPGRQRPQSVDEGDLESGGVLRRVWPHQERPGQLPKWPHHARSPYDPVLVGIRQHGQKNH